MDAPSASGAAAATPATNISPEQLAKLSAALDNGIWYALGLWQALTVAVQGGWGGSETLEKRDWFAGAVSTLLAERPDTDQEDLEVFLLQIMEDEFDCRVEDETEVEVAKNIMNLRTTLLRDGQMTAFHELQRRWENRGQLKGEVRVNDQTDAGDDEEEFQGFDDDEDGDVDMDEAPSLVPAAPPRQKELPVVDEDGFTKVVGKKKR